LLVLIACIPKKQLVQMGNDFKASLQESIGRLPRFFAVIGYSCIAAFVLGHIARIGGDLLDWPAVANFGGKAKFASLMLLLVFGWSLLQAMKANLEDRHRAGLRAFLKPRENMKIEIHGHNSGTVAVGGRGSQIAQSAQGSPITVMNRDEVEKEPRLYASARAEAIEELNALTDQWERPVTRREQFKITKALERIPAILSSVSTLAESWQKLEPFIKAHFG
jgi:hypothetical protein